MEHQKAASTVSQAVLDRVQALPPGAQRLFFEVRKLLLACAPEGTAEALWAGMPSYTLDGRFVRLIPFRDYLNIEAAGISSLLSLPADCRRTPHGMLQVFVNQNVPETALTDIFRKTLNP